MEVKRSARKIRAALVAGTLAGAIALTGTLAWRNMTQHVRNEALADKNPGGRIHDDFDGVNKDIYAENFTDLEKGAPVFARIRLLEYMEVGEEAGVNRGATDDDGDGKPDRKVKVTTYTDGTGAEVEPDINDTSTWYVHKPETAVETDPFHEYWRWDTGGQTIYMPTFNKNKDSITPEVNGTYLGPDKEFNIDDPYEDNVTYTDGQKLTADAYYDADGDDIDENYGKLGDQPFDGIPGAGGDRKDPDADPPVEDPDYEVKSEEHIAHATLNGLGVITMDEWKKADMPVCNKWVWDEDGWFYWPEPILPQTATGLLLDKLSQGGGTSEKCYYAIEVEGQFVSVDLDWGEPEETGDDGSVTKEATGFYIDGFTADAKALLEQAADVVINGENWYLPIVGQINLFQQIKDDDGKLGDPFLAGDDRTPGTADDRHDVIFVESGVTVSGTDYGNWFLAPRTTDPYYEPYYRGVGRDGQLGTIDDTRLWLLSGEFPTGELTDKIADKVLVTKPVGTVDIEGSNKIEMEVGTTLAQPFTATVKLGEEPMSGDRGAVYWEVSSALVDESLATGTKITRDTGVLTVDPEEKAAELIVTAKCKMDDRVEGTYRVKPFGKLNVRLTLAESTDNFTSIQGGKSVRLQATLYRGDEEALAQPAAFTWGTPSVVTGAATLTADGTDPRIGVLFVDRAAFAGKNVVFTVGWDVNRTGTSFSVPITAPAPVNVTVTALGVDSVEAGGTLNFQAAIEHADELADATVTWKTFGADGNEITDMLVITPDDTNNTVAVKVKGAFVLSEKTNPVTVKAFADDPTAGGGSGSTTFTVIPPASVTVTPASGSLKYATKFQMSAQLKRADGNNYTSNQVTWKVTDTAGNTIDGVTIDETGALRVGRIFPNGTKFKVTATSKVSSDVSNMTKVTLDDYDVTIDGVSFLVLEVDTYDDKALLLTKDCICINEFAGFAENHWGLAGHIFNDALTPFMDSHRTLNAAAIPTTTYARAPYNSNNFVSPNNTERRVFLLSAADIFGTAGAGSVTATYKDYTTGSQLEDPSGKKWVAKYNGSAIDWWTRSNAGTETETIVTTTGVEGTRARTNNTKVGVRPALYVDTTVLTF